MSYELSTQTPPLEAISENDFSFSTILNDNKDSESCGRSTVCLKSSNEVLARKNFLCLNVLELPEKVYVETRFVSHSVDNVNDLAINTEPIPIQLPTENTSTEFSSISEGIEVVPNIVKNTPNIIENMAKTDVNTPMENTLKVRSVHTMTDSDIPTRERAQQTENVTGKSVALQCNILEEEELAERSPIKVAAMEEESAERRPIKVAATAPTADFDSMMTATKNDRAHFLLFVAQNCQQYDDKFECQVCGEVTATVKSMNAHMVVHWGPPGLCYRCGRYFEHYRLLDEHHCEMRKKRKVRKTLARYRCPYYRCSVTAISQLELYDHINEHSAQCSYHCKGCKRNFTTACELRHHLPTNPNCRKTKCYPYGKDLIKSKSEMAYRVRVHRVYSSSKKYVAFKTFLSLRQRSRHLKHTTGSRRCQICLKLCTNSFMYDMHRKRCLQNFEYRMHRHRSTLATAQHRK